MVPGRPPFCVIAMADRGAGPRRPHPESAVHRENCQHSARRLFTATAYDSKGTQSSLGPARPRIADSHKESKVLHKSCCLQFRHRSHSYQPIREYLEPSGNPHAQPSSRPSSREVFVYERATEHSHWGTLGGTVPGASPQSLPLPGSLWTL